MGGLIEIEKLYLDSYQELFNKAEFQSTPFIERGFAMDKKIAAGSILFIGLNPSYRKGEKPRSFFYDIEQVKDDEYFKKFWVIANECNSPCAHLDLLALRETSHKQLKPVLKSAPEFIQANLNLSKSILELSNPKVIVVTDTLARQLLGKIRQNIGMGYEFSSFRTDGTYRITNQDSNLKDVPVLFSGMLSGQHALDNGSFERLKWHIKGILEGRIRNI